MDVRGGMAQIVQSRNALRAAEQLMQFLADQRNGVQTTDEDFSRVKAVRAELQAAVAETPPDNLLHLVSVNRTPAE